MAIAQEITLTSKDGSKIYYPHTEASLVKDSETGKTVKEQLDTLDKNVSELSSQIDGKISKDTYVQSDVIFLGSNTFSHIAGTEFLQQTK